MTISRSCGRLNRLQITFAFLSSAYFLAPWVMINNAVGGHAKFQPFGTIIGFLGDSARSRSKVKIAGEIFEVAVNSHIGDVSDDTGYAYFCHRLAEVRSLEDRYKECSELEIRSSRANTKAFHTYQLPEVPTPTVETFSFRRHRRNCVRAKSDLLAIAPGLRGTKARKGYGCGRRFAKADATPQSHD